MISIFVAFQLFMLFSGSFCWSLLDSTGFCWSPVVSTCMQWSLLASSGLCLFTVVFVGLFTGLQLPLLFSNGHYLSPVVSVVPVVQWSMLSSGLHYLL